jgi:DNA-binding NarL/FixJ family response regulator
MKTALSAAEVRAAASRLLASGLIVEVASADGARVYRVLGLSRTAASATPVPPPPPTSPTVEALAGVDSVAARYGLTPAETNVLALLATGLSNEQIGQKLFVSSATVRTHVYNLFRKLGVRSRVQATLLVMAGPAGSQTPQPGA